MRKLQLIAAATAQLYADNQLAGALLILHTRAHSTSSKLCTTSAAFNTIFMPN
jgi:hypothetical protein